MGTLCIAKGSRLETRGEQVSESNLSSLEGIKCTKESHQLLPFGLHGGDCQSARAVINTYLIDWWLINNRNVFLTVLLAGSPISGCQLGRVLVRAYFLVHIWLSSLCVLMW